MKQAVSALLLSTAYGATYDYAQNGADWPSLTMDNNQCGSTNQSPINLVSKGKSGFNYPLKDAKEDDEISKQYANQFGVNVNFNGHTSQTDLSGSGPANYFTSKLAETEFGGDTTFNAAQFHFHAGSEHTIDGERYDLEMHSVHLPAEKKGDVFAAAMGIMFSVDKYTADLSWSEQRIIDAFFDGLEWTKLNGKNTPNVVDFVSYGNLMEMVDTSNRWAYKGSLTTPPCTTFVYFNVLTTIYPISHKHLTQFKNQLNQGESGNLDERGNYRLIQEVDEHGVVYIEGDEPKVVKSTSTVTSETLNDIQLPEDPKDLTIVIVILGVLSLIFLIAAVAFGAKYSAAKDKN